MLEEAFTNLPRWIQTIVALALFWAPIFFLAAWSKPIGRFGSSRPDWEIEEWKAKRERWGFPVGSGKGKWIVPLVFFLAYGVLYIILPRDK